MRRLVIIMVLVLASTAAFAGQEEALDLALKSSEFAKAKAAATGRFNWSINFGQPSIKVTAQSTGMAGSVTQYWVQQGYAFAMDWNSFSDAIVVIVTESTPTMQLPGQPAKPPKIEVKKVIPSLFDFASAPELAN